MGTTSSNKISISPLNRSGFLTTREPKSLRSSHKHAEAEICPHAKAHEDTLIAAKIRLSSDWANPLNGSRNGLADDDGCVEFAPDAARLKGVTVGRLETATGRGLSDRIL